MRSSKGSCWSHSFWPSVALLLPLGAIALPGCGATPDSSDPNPDPARGPGSAIGVLGPAVSEEMVEGRIEAVAHDDIVRKAHWMEYSLVTGDGIKHKIEFPAKSATLASGQSIRMMATRVGDTLTVSPAALERLGRISGGVHPLIEPLGSRRLAVIPVKLTTDPNTYFTVAQANGMVFTNPDSMNSYYKQVSFNKLSLTGTVFNWQVVPPQADCGAMTALAEQQVGDLSSYDHVMFLVPGQPDFCTPSGFADLPGRHSTIGLVEPRMMTHELGHNFGAGHANAWVCNEAGGNIRVALDVDANCFSDEYDDVFDPMGVGYRHFNSYNKWRFGYLPTANQTDVTGEGEFTILPIEQNLTGLQSLRIRRNTVDPDAQYFYLDFRQPLAPFDTYASGDSAVNGVQIRLGSASAIDGPPTRLIDTRPDTPDYPFDADEALTQGRAVYDSNGGNAFYVLSANSSGARVRVLANRTPIKINFQPSSAPVPSGYLVDSGAVYGARGNGQTYGWNVANTANAVDLNSPNTPGADQRYDTFEWTQKAGGGSVWELAVPNGTYLVRIGAGEDSTNAFYHTLVEGQVILSDGPVTGATWLHRSKVVTVSDGKVTVTNGNGAVNNKINFIEVVSLDVTSSMSLLSANFNSGTDNFTYADNTFRNANNGAYASGTRLSTGGSGGTGGLQVLLGGIDSSLRNVISGGWKATFTLALGATITLNFDYNLTINNYESDEYGEVLASVDGILTGTGGNSEVARLNGGSSSATTGWKSSPTLIPGWFPAGTHTLIIGGNNNKKNASNETTDIRIDNVVLRKQ